MRTTFLRVATAAGTLGVLAIGGLLFSQPANAQVVSGYQTGYTYHQGLAIGDGGALMAAGGSAAPASSANLSSTNVPSGSTASGLTPSVTTPASSGVSAPAVTPSVAPANTTVAPAANQGAAVNTALPSNSSIVSLFSPAVWAGIIIALLLVVAAGIAAAARSMGTSSVTTTTTRRRTAY